MTAATKPQAHTPYQFRDWYIPERMMGAIRRYIDDHVMPGDFLCAVIANDLKEACGRADDENLANLPAYVAYFYNEAPSTCWGSEVKLKAWFDFLPPAPLPILDEDFEGDAAEERARQFPPQSEDERLDDERRG